MWISALGAGLLIGFGSFIYQTTTGLGSTGLSNTIPWGMYIVSFMFKSVRADQFCARHHDQPTGRNPDKEHERHDVHAPRNGV